MAAKGIPFALLILYANILTATEFGILGTFTAVLALAGVYVGFRPEAYIYKVHAEARNLAVARHLKALYQLLALSFLIVLILLVAGAEWLPIEHDERWLFAGGVALTALIQGSIVITDTFLVSSDKPKAYALSQFTAVLSFLLISLPLVYLTRDWIGRVIGDLVAYSLAGVVSLLLVKRHLRRLTGGPISLFGRAESPSTKAAFSFLFPVTFHVIGFAAVNMLDRLLIADIMDVEAVGRYTAAYSLGMVLGVAHDAALRAWNPHFFRMVNEGAFVQRRLWHIQCWYAVGAIVSAILFGFGAAQAFEYLFPSEYHSAKNLIMPICLAYGFEGVRKIFCGYLYHRGRTKSLALITVCASILNILLNLWWIPINGLIGAAFATLAAFVFMTGAVLILVRWDAIPALQANSQNYAEKA